MTGPTYAHASAVVARSYSRISGQVSADDTTNTPGIAARHAAAKARSCAWLT
jgi:hypothetical protein